MPDGIDQKQPRRLAVEDFQGDLNGILHKVRDGASFLITADGRVLAELRPAPEAVPPARREPGALRGRIWWMAPDFDDLPPDILDAMEGED